MEFLCYHRDRAGSTRLRAEMVEEHWSYMDRYDAVLVARGPTFADDETPTGSLHVIELPDAVAARTFAFDEPGYQAGVYRDVLLRRTHWRRRHDSEDDRFLVLGFVPRPEPYTGMPDLDAEVTEGGPLLSDDGSRLLGFAALVAASDTEDPGAALATDRWTDVEVHRWEPGGRR